ncbi:hypothetical protein AB0F17_11555 [Nonomuraea sp. NPDC026600]|uniref:hypothetical protein n=1 Tax=Nonomuraea sp. NPDC026600 TaxID=3155363 RepID=UPI0033CC3249
MRPCWVEQGRPERHPATYPRHPDVLAAQRRERARIRWSAPPCHRGLKNPANLIRPQN